MRHQRDPPSVSERRRRAPAAQLVRLCSPWSEGLERTIAWYREFLGMTGTRRRASREQILDLVREYHARRPFRRAPFVPGETPVPVSGRVFDAAEMQSLVDSVARFLADHRPLCRQFEHEFARCSACARATLVNPARPRTWWRSPL